ncbi:hypothetical protein [Ponticoccus litoralis]|uniref:Uncharacterized protein n=1 Tax=Ponticoccus litoralis TaxID=422297 RepID=A0AAW9SV85_9RHOB
MTKMIASAASLAAMMAHAPTAVIGTPRMDAAGNVEKLLGEVKSELERVGSDVRQTAEEALKQANRVGDLNAETKAARRQGACRVQRLVGRALEARGQARGARDAQPRHRADRGAG